MSSTLDSLQLRDLRGTALHDRTADYFRHVLEPSFGKISAVLEPFPSPDGTTVAFAGQIRRQLNDNPFTRIFVTSKNEPNRGWAWPSTQLLAPGSFSEKQPRFSVDGQYLAFLSDHQTGGSYQLQIRHSKGTEAVEFESLKGSIEQIRWHNDSSRLLCLLAEDGVSKSSLAGSGKDDRDDEQPSWIPKVDASMSRKPRRTLYVYRVNDKQAVEAMPLSLNVWEAEWCGPEHVLAVVSDTPGEEAWYGSRVSIIHLESLMEEVVYKPKAEFQPGLPKADPTGKFVAFAESRCSDRGVLAGDLVCINTWTKIASYPKTHGVDVTSIEWIDSSRLVYFGVRNMTIVAGTLDVEELSTHEFWSAEEGTTCPGLQPETIHPIPNSGSFPIILESFAQCPRLVTVKPDGTMERMKTLDDQGAQWLDFNRRESQFISWKSQDGLDIHGLLRLPKSGSPPYPMVVNVHGGPVCGYRNTRNMVNVDGLLTANGFAVLMPNIRGSSNRGQDFTGHVLGDMGGADAGDILSGIDHLLDEGLVDASRIGIMGGSNGGFLTNWIVTQTDRFAAGVAISPVSDWLSQHTTTNIPMFDQMFMRADPYDAQGPYRLKSPVMYAGTFKTPVMQTAGTEDDCTPAGQAIQYHRAMLEKDVTSVCVIYPGEGHGVRKWPAYIDYCARILGWFDHFMS